MDERIRQASEWKSPETRRRVRVALAQLEASEAMRWSPLPDAASSWIASLLCYFVSIVILALAIPAPLKVGLIGLPLMATIALLIDAITLPDRRRELQSVLADIVVRSSASHSVVAERPQEVIASWRQVRRTYGQPELSRVAKWAQRWAAKWKWSRKLSKKTPYWAKRPWWSFKRVMGVSSYTTHELATATVEQVNRTSSW